VTWEQSPGLKWASIFGLIQQMSNLGFYEGIEEEDWPGAVNLISFDFGYNAVYYHTYEVIYGNQEKRIQKRVEIYAGLL
jgi:hypothetical protein